MELSQLTSQPILILPPLPAIISPRPHNPYLSGAPTAAWMHTMGPAVCPCLSPVEVGTDWKGGDTGMSVGPFPGRLATLGFALLLA